MTLARRAPSNLRSEIAQSYRDHGLRLPKHTFLREASASLSRCGLGRAHYLTATRGAVGDPEVLDHARAIYPDDDDWEQRRVSVKNVKRGFHLNGVPLATDRYYLANVTGESRVLCIKKMYAILVDTNFQASFLDVQCFHRERVRAHGTRMFMFERYGESERKFVDPVVLRYVLQCVESLREDDARVCLLQAKKLFM